MDALSPRQDLRFDVYNRVNRVIRTPGSPSQAAVVDLVDDSKLATWASVVIETVCEWIVREEKLGRMNTQVRQAIRQEVIVPPIQELLNFWPRLDNIEQTAAVTELRIQALKALLVLDGPVSALTRHIIRHGSWRDKLRAGLLWLGGAKYYQLDDRYLGAKL